MLLTVNYTLLIDISVVAHRDGRHWHSKLDSEP